MARDHGSKDAKQSERFIQAAKAAGVDETGKSFERAFKKVVPAKKPPKRKS